MFTECLHVKGCLEHFAGRVAHLIFTTNLTGRYYHSYCNDEESQTQSGQIISPGLECN